MSRAEAQSRKGTPLFAALRLCTRSFSVLVALSLIASPVLAQGDETDDKLLEDPSPPVPEPVPAAEPAPSTEPAPASQPAELAPSTQPALQVPEPSVPAVPEIPPLGPVDASERLDAAGLLVGSPGYYALWYGPEWALVGVMGALEVFNVFDLVPPPPALFGPSFNDQEPDGAVLSDPRLDDVIGRPFVREKVPPLAVAVVGLSGLLSAGVVDVVRHGELQHTHNLVLGGLTAITGTMLVTNVMKAGFGRLRPDFRDRYRYASCQGLAPRSPVVNCAAQQAGGFTLPDDEYLDGYRSFPSGHASSSFAFATYLSLWLGSEFVWAKDAGGVEAGLGTLGIGALYSAALFTAATRLSDNRHHPEDVAVGAGLGAGIAAASWLLHFDLEGNARWRGVDVAPGPGDAGISVVGRF